MKRVSLAPLVVMTLAAVALSGCTVAGEGSSADRPTWRAGYTWAFDSGYEAEWVESYDGERDNGTWSEEGHYTMQVVNTTFSQDGEDYYLVLEDHADHGGLNLAAYRQRDLQFEWVDWDIDVDCDGGVCVTEGDIVIDPWGQPRPTYLDFPLNKGKRWSDVQEEGDDYITIQFLTVGEVVGQAAVNTPIGVVPALEVRLTSSIANIDELLDYIRDDMEYEGIEVTKLEGDFREVETVFYSPEYMIPVRADMVETSTFILEGSYEGESFSSEERYTEHSWLEMTGASMVAGPERTVDEILTMMADRVDLVDPTGATIEAPAYWVSIDEVRSRTAAPDGPGLQFDAVIEGAQALPEGHGLVWTVYDWTGKRVADSSDTRLDFKGAPGHYQIVLTSFTDESIISEAFADGFIDYEATHVLDCGEAELFGTGVPADCQEFDIPVHPGAERLVIVADVTSIDDAVRAGDIRLTDVYGTEIRASSQGDSDRLEIDQMYQYSLSSQPWEVDYYQTQGIGSEGTLKVDIRYGEAVVGDVAYAVEGSCCQAEGAREHFLGMIRR